LSARSWAALLALGCIWGSSFLYIRVAVEEVNPLQVVLFRTAAGAAVLLCVIAVQRRRLDLSPAYLRGVLLLSLVGTVTPFLLISWAETEIDSGPASVLNATMPLFTAVFAAIFLADERLTLRGVAGIVLGLGGVLILVGEDVSAITDAGFLAALAIVGASAAYGASAVFVRTLVRTGDAVVLSASQIAVSAVVCGAIAAVASPPAFALSASVWASFAALGFLGTGVAYLIYYWLIEHEGSVRASLVTYIIPIVGVTLGAIVLAERVRWNTFAGGGVIALGVATGTGGLDRVLAGVSTNPIVPWLAGPLRSRRTRMPTDDRP
jgi:drug/metabolite transporter (DMT)-like permease